MAVLPVSLARVSTLLSSNVALSQLTSTQAQLLQVQNELTTGKKLNAPSDNPGDAAIAMQIRKTIELRQSFSANLDSANDQLSSVDTSLSSISDLLQQAQTISSANVGDDVTQDARNAAADQVDSIYSQLTDLGNTSFEGSYIYGGDKADQPPFKEIDGSMSFVGSETTLENQVDESTDASFQVDGAQVWGALSTRVESANPLAPTLTTDTRLTDLAGANNNGINLGTITINNGTTNAKIDLSKANTVGDVIDTINNAGLGSVTAGLNAAGTGITISDGATETLSVTDTAGGTTAGDLGILSPTPAAAGAPIVGASAKPKVTELTTLASLNGGAGIDLSGLTITNGTKSATIDLSSAKTVQDLMNAVNGANLGVRMDINADGTGMRLLNTTQGTDMSVSENGGTTAADLGIRSFDPTSPLSELNGGAGVGIGDGADFSIADSTGKSFDVDLTTSTKTVQDVIDTINSSATAAGAGVTASFATNGNGIVLTDTASGSGTLTVTSKDTSTAAKDLGITGKAVSNVITGTDVDPVQAKGIFADVDALRTSLRSGDKQAITKAAGALQDDYNRVVQSRGAVGAQVQAIQGRQSNLADENVSTQTLLSKLEDTDFTTAATQYSELQTSLQAALETTSKMLNLSLMDFLK